MSELTEWHGRFGGREWRVTPAGVQSRDPGGNGTLHRTGGVPLTMRLYLASWRDQLLSAASSEGVPLPLLLMVVATENGRCLVTDNKPYVIPVRREPGYVDDVQTPHRISVGPCHLLISTAQGCMGDPSVNRAWLLDVANNLRAAARYIAQQVRVTGFDPVLVAAAYNAGGVYRAVPGESRYGNPWHIRSYGSHLDRAAAWYGDALAALHETLQLAALMDQGPQLGTVA